jgi:hypothetical protein
MTQQASREHTCVVRDHQVALVQVTGQVTDPAVLDRSSRTVEDEEAGFSRFRRNLRNKLRRKIEVEIGDSHA